MSSFESIATKCPHIEKEWDYSKNKLSPNKIAYGSHKLIWLFCSNCGVSYSKITKDRSKKSIGLCPKCSRLASAKKRNYKNIGLSSSETIRKRKLNNGLSLEDKRPDIAKQWDYKSNYPNTPKDFTCGSHVNVFWLCDKKHSYKQIIKAKVNGEGCPFCQNKKLLSGFNDLKTVRPDIAKYWDYEKNDNLKPEDVVFGSSKIVWWKCNNEHHFKRKIYDMTSNKNKCPICMGKKVLKGYNDFETLRPEMAKEWDYENNNGRIPSEFTCGSGFRAHWKCAKGHKWITSISSRTSDNTQCPECSSELRTSFPEQTILFYVNKYFKNIETRNSYLGKEADIIIEDYKTIVEYDGVYWHKRKKLKDINKNNLFTSKGYKVYRIREYGLEDIPNSYNLFIDKKNNFEEVLIILFKRLGINKPDIDLKRDNHQIYSQYTKMIKRDSLLFKYPELAMDWDYLNNGSLTPDIIRPCSRIRVNWLCHNCGHKWQTYLQSRTRSSSKCPNCTRKNLVRSKAKPRKRILNITTNETFNYIGDVIDKYGGTKKEMYKVLEGRRSKIYDCECKWIPFE